MKDRYVENRAPTFHPHSASRQISGLGNFSRYGDAWFVHQGVVALPGANPNVSPGFSSAIRVRDNLETPSYKFDPQNEWLGQLRNQVLARLDRSRLWNAQKVEDTYDVA